MLPKKKPAKRYLAGSVFTAHLPSEQTHIPAQPAVSPEELERAANKLLAEYVEKEPTILFDQVLVHYCQYIPGIACRCQQLISPAQARQMVEVGQAVWGPLPDFSKLPVTKQHPIILAKVTLNVPRSGVPGASHIIRRVELMEQGSESGVSVPARVKGEKATHSIVRMIQEWPEFEDVTFTGNELIVWAAVFDGGVNASNIVDAAKEINVTPAELDSLFKSAKQKISDGYAVAKRLKRGVFANWSKLPADFEEVPVDAIEKRLAIYARIQLTDEFKSLDEDIRAAFTAWATHRTNYTEAAAASDIPESSLRRRVQDTFKHLHEIQLAETAKSVAFDAIGGSFFGFEDGVDSHANAENMVMAKAGGGSINGHILYGGTRQLIDEGGVKHSQLRQRKLEGFDKALANYGMKLKDTKRYVMDGDQSGGAVGETDDYGEESRA